MVLRDEISSPLFSCDSHSSLSRSSIRSSRCCWIDAARDSIVALVDCVAWKFPKTKVSSQCLVMKITR